MKLPYQTIEKALKLLEGRLMFNNSPRYTLVVCGGTALNALQLVLRTTQDVDIVALLDNCHELVDPAPFPQDLVTAAQEVAATLNLAKDWLNNGPSSGDGGLFRLGLPQGFKQRLVQSYSGERLTIYLASRLDQIHFKLYAAIDQLGSYHAADLRELQPTENELLQALRWAITHDPSDGFRFAAKLFLDGFGYASLVDRL
ncbi:hypothetical protein ACFL6U_31285 [Planctomycetota bacterium]